MKIKLTFLGAARNVTGSQYLVEADSRKILVDCGLYQERELKSRNWASFSVPPQDINAVLLTHAHLDHCGLLPRLVQEGFHGPIYSISATAEIAEIILLDSASVMQEDAAFKKRRHEKEGRKAPYPEIPLYTAEDARACSPLFAAVKYREPVMLGSGIEASFHDAGHVLGSSMVMVKIKLDGESRSIIFSGDIGRWGKPMLDDPSVFTEADYILMESTYGDRSLETVEDAAGQLAEIINMTAKEGGNVVIPSFALERSQEILYFLNRFLMEGKIPPLKVFVDSPMAVSITDVFRRHPELLDDEMRQLLQKNSPFDFPGLNLVRTVEESKKINQLREPAIIIAGSGMCTGGRIKHHLVTNISRTESTILFAGYQAEGTLGREIVSGAHRVRILGQHYPVKARIAQLHGFSAHADRDELLKWLSGIRRPPRRLFITHGEPDMTEHFARLVRERTGWETAVPDYMDKAILD